MCVSHVADLKQPAVLPLVRMSLYLNMHQLAWYNSNKDIADLLHLLIFVGFSLLLDFA
jgi:hypothetical protein